MIQYVYSSEVTQLVLGHVCAFVPTASALCARQSTAFRGPHTVKCGGVGVRFVWSGSLCGGQDQPRPIARVETMAPAPVMSKRRRKPGGIHCVMCSQSVVVTYREVSRQKCTYCLGMFSCLLVVLVGSTLQALLEQAPLIFMREAESEAGQVDLTLSPASHQGFSFLNYTLATEQLAESPTPEQVMPPSPPPLLAPPPSWRGGCCSSAVAPLPSAVVADCVCVVCAWHSSRTPLRDCSWTSWSMPLRTATCAGCVCLGPVRKVFTCVLLFVVSCRCRSPQTTPQTPSMPIHPTITRVCVVAELRV